MSGSVSSRRRFREIYDANYDDLWRYCLRRAHSPEEAEEALAETFATAWRRLDSVPEHAAARPWLFAVARNQLRNGWRKDSRHNDLKDRLIATRQSARTADPAEVTTDRSALILTALATLRERDQEILRLVAWEELPHAEIAVVIGCSENAVAIRVHRARARLSRAIEKKESVKGPTNSQHTAAVDPTTSKWKAI